MIFVSVCILCTELTRVFRAIKSNLKTKVMELEGQKMIPHLSVVQVGSREDSSLYVKMKQQASTNVYFTRTVSDIDILRLEFNSPIRYCRKLCLRKLYYESSRISTKIISFTASLFSFLCLRISMKK